MSLTDLIAKVKRRLPSFRLPDRARRAILRAVLTGFYFAVVTPLGMMRRRLGLEDSFKPGHRPAKGWQEHRQSTADKKVYRGMA